MSVAPARALALLDALYGDQDGGQDASFSAARRAREISRGAIEARGDEGGWRHLSYGEVGFVALRCALQAALKHVAISEGPAGSEVTPCADQGDRLRARGGDVTEGLRFLDIGSGTGRATLAAAMLSPRLTSLHGVELIAGLDDLACDALRRYLAEVAPGLPEAHRRQEITFACGDALESDWRGVDVAFCCATLFPAALVARVEAKAAAEMRRGAAFILLTHEFASSAASGKIDAGEAAWTLVDDRERRMSWGPARVRVYVKR